MVAVAAGLPRGHGARHGVRARLQRRARRDEVGRHGFDGVLRMGRGCVHAVLVRPARGARGGLHDAGAWAGPAAVTIAPPISKHSQWCYRRRRR